MNIDSIITECDVSGKFDTSFLIILKSLQKATKDRNDVHARFFDKVFRAFLAHKGGNYSPTLPPLEPACPDMAPEPPPLQRIPVCQIHHEP